MPNRVFDVRFPMDIVSNVDAKEGAWFGESGGRDLPFAAGDGDFDRAAFDLARTPSFFNHE